MIDYSWLFNLGSLILLLASFPNIYSAIKDRNILKGYSKYGSALTLVGILFFIVYAGLQEYWIGVLLDVPTVIYWTVTTIYTWK